MNITKVTMKNFRCFYGKQEIKFSTDKEKNITLIHAQNGVGKTTFLNAILWCFYGKLSKGFENPNDLINSFALENDQLKNAYVGIEFDHKDENYYIQRVIEAGSTKSDLKIHKIESDGNYRPIDETNFFMSSIIPYEMAQYFFFDGENAEAFGSTANSDQVSQAIKDILGCGIVNRTINDLDEIRKINEREIQKQSSDQDVEVLKEQITNAEKQLELAERDYKNCIFDRDSIENQISDIIEQLRNTAGAVEQQKRRDSLEQQKKDIESGLDLATAQRKNWLTNWGTYVVSKGVTSTAFDFLEDMREKGRIPSPYNETFVKDLLNSIYLLNGKNVHKCICGRTFEDGDDAYRTIASLLDKATTLDLENKISKVKSTVDCLKRETPKSFGHLSSIETTIANFRNRKTKLEQEIADCGKKIENSVVDDARKLEERRKELQEEVTYLNKKIWENETQSSKLKQSILETQKEIERIVEDTGRAKIFIKRKNLAVNLRDLLKNSLKNEEVEVNKIISNQINKILKGIMRKDISVSISDDFKITMKIDGKKLGKSSGENQLLSLAFISALIWFAKLRANAHSSFLLPGTIAPLVLDSPFGQLDDSYKPQTAKFIPTMSSQVVMLVSGSQGDASVMKSIENKVGSEYILIRKNTASRDDTKPIDIITIGSKKYEQTLYDCDTNGTIVEKIERN